LREAQSGELRFSGARRVENLALRSNDFDDATWSKTNVTFTSGQTDADGGTDAWAFTPSTDNLTHRISQVSLTGNLLSITAKADGYNYLRVDESGANSTRAIFNLTDGTVSGIPAGITAATVDLGSGWYRCYAYNDNFVPGAEWDSPRIYVQETAATSAESFAGDGTSGLLIYNVQMEAVWGQTTKTPGEYQDTTTAAVASYYWKDLAGNELRPTASVDGATRFASYAPHAVSSAVSVGDRRIPVSADGGVNLIAGTSTGDRTEDLSEGWTNTNTTDAQDATAPDGVANGANTLTADSGTFAAYVSLATAYSVTVDDYIISAFVKAGTHDYIWIGDRGDAAGIRSATFDLTDGSVVGNSNGTGSVVDVGGGWYWCRLTYARANASTCSPRLAFGDSSHTIDHPSLTLAGTETLLLWGMKGEQASAATRYNSISELQGAGDALGRGSLASPNGLYYECTTAGTTGSIEPIWPVNLTDTIEDNGVVWTCQGYYRTQGAFIEEARTNSILQSRDFDTTWTVTSTPTSAQDETGIDGTTTAWTLGDDHGSASERFNQTVTISDDSNTHNLSLYIKKDSDESRFPELALIFSGGTGQQLNTQINTKTGATSDRVSVGSGTSGVIDAGDWWRLWVSLPNNGTGNTSAEVRIFPALGNTLGASDTSATGTIVADMAQLELTKSYPGSPIPTTTVAVTRNADALSYPEPTGFDTAGVVVLDVTPNYQDTSDPLEFAAFSAYLNNTNYNRLVCSTAGARTGRLEQGLRSTSGGAISEQMTGDDFVTATESRIGGVWNATDYGPAAFGVAATREASIDPLATGTTLHIGSTNGTEDHIEGHIHSVLIYAEDPGSAKVASVTTRDAE
jgi:hypothetical protein